MARNTCNSEHSYKGPNASMFLSIKSQGLKQTQTQNRKVEKKEKTKKNHFYLFSSVLRISGVFIWLGYMSCRGTTSVIVRRIAVTCFQEKKGILYNLTRIVGGRVVTSTQLLQQLSILNLQTPKSKIKHRKIPDFLLRNPSFLRFCLSTPFPGNEMPRISKVKPLRKSSDVTIRSPELSF